MRELKLPGLAKGDGVERLSRLLAPPLCTLSTDFTSVLEMSRIIAAHQQELRAPGITEEWLSLRHGTQKPVREAWHAYMFAVCYAFHRGIPLDQMYVKPEADEYSFRDATLRWGTPGDYKYMNLQLKELPPAHRNDKVQLEHILKGVSKKYHKAYDLAVAIYLNRSERFETVMTPTLEIQELWFFGFKDPGLTTIFVRGMTRAGDVTFDVPWKTTPKQVSEVAIAGN